jgi:hypothetical protein
MIAPDDGRARTDGDALEKVIMGLYSHGVQIIAGTDAAGHGSP